MSRIAERDLGFDALRGVAILCVVAIHSLGYMGNVQRNGSDTASFWIMIFFRQILNFAVPVFLFVSGYFCPRKEGGGLQFIKKQVPRVLVPYLVWSLILLIVFPLIKSEHISWFRIPYDLLTGGASGPYYFVLLIVQMYFLTPFFLRLMRFGKRGGALVLAINLFALGCFYLFRFIFDISIPFKLYALPAYSWLGFYYFGLYVGQNGNMGKRLAAGLTRWSGLASLYLLLSCMEASAIIHSSGNISYATSAVKFSSFAFSVTVIAMFFGVKLKVKSYPRILLLIGDYSFGIYLIHMIVLTQIGKPLGRMELFLRLPVLPSMVVAVITVLVCICIVHGARKVLGKKISVGIFGL